MRKDKVYELKIQEDDDLSGIDSISLVDQPAIEINWVAFSKEKSQEFHIPDNEDDNYLEQLAPYGQSEQDLFDDGFEIDRMKFDTKEDFTYSYPNAQSDIDTPNFRIRYKYVLNPMATGPSVIPTTRNFCKTLVTKNLVFRLEDMLSQRNDFGQSFADWRGGYNCRHLFAKIIYKKKGYIPNNAKGKDTIGYDILGDKQNDTRTKNPSFSKEEFGGKVSFDYDGTLTTLEGRLKAEQLIKNGYDVYIVTSRGKGESAPVYKMADKLGIKHDCVFFTNGKPKSDTLKRLGIQKHYDNNPEVLKEIEKNAPGIEAEHFDYNVGSIGGYVDPGLKKKPIPKSVAMMSEVDYLFNREPDSKQNFTTDVDKQIVLGPAMVPNQKIFRRDSAGNPYYVFFSPETIKMIADKYMKNKFIDNNDLQHDGEAVPDVFVVESWIKESKNDKSTDYGYEHLPVGTWFVSMKINNPDVWKMVKEHKLNGFSVSGYFEEVADFMKEKAFLAEVAKIISNIKD